VPGGLRLGLGWRGLRAVERRERGREGEGGGRGRRRRERSIQTSTWMSLRVSLMVRSMPRSGSSPELVAQGHLDVATWQYLDGRLMRSFYAVLCVIGRAWPNARTLAGKGGAWN